MIRLTERFPRTSLVVRTAYYLAILVGLFLLATADAYQRPGFIYQGF
jgi:hypothetical protein